MTMTIQDHAKAEVHRFAHLYGCRRCGTTFDEWMIRQIPHAIPLRNVFGNRHEAAVEPKVWLANYQAGTLTLGQRQGISITKVGVKELPWGIYPDGLKYSNKSLEIIAECPIVPIVIAKHPYSYTISMDRRVRSTKSGRARYQFSMKWALELYSLYDGWMAWLKQHGGIIIRYEDAIVDPIASVKEIAVVLGLKAPGKVTLEDRTLAQRPVVGFKQFNRAYYVNKGWMKIGRELRALAHEHVDWTIAERMGYTK